MMRRRGGLVRGVARTAAVAGTASAVSGRVHHRQANKWGAEQQQTAAAQQAAYDQGIADAQAAPPPPPPPAGGGEADLIHQLKELAALRDSGVLTEAEFEQQKAKILGWHASGDPYAALAEDYHWYFDDVAFALGCDTPGVRAAIAGLGPGSRVLDAACGIGVDTVALSRQGFDVSGSDASPAMLERARARAQSALGDGAIEFAACAWTELPAHLDTSSFDAILCVGSSIAHAGDELVAALEAFRTLLVPRGVLILDTLDWEVVHELGSRVEIEPRVVTRDGIRCVRTYAWHVPADLGDPWELDVAPIFLDGDRASLRSHRLELWPFTRSRLRSALATAGFERIALDAIPGDDRYTATARRPVE